jgi:hypothetical protein
MGTAQQAMSQPSPVAQTAQCICVFRTILSINRTIPRIRINSLVVVMQTSVFVRYKLFYMCYTRIIEVDV